VVAVETVADAVKADLLDEVFFLAGLVLHLQPDLLLRFVLLCAFAHIGALDYVSPQVPL
jgi:hypothetical protein